MLIPFIVLKSLYLIATLTKKSKLKWGITPKIELSE
jgi:hypothetical protein